MTHPERSPVEVVLPTDRAEGWPKHWHGRHGWRPGTGPPPWMHRGGHAKRRIFLARFIVFFAVMLSLVVGGMAVLAFLLTRFFGGDNSITFLVWLIGCGVVLGLPMLALALGGACLSRLCRSPGRHHGRGRSGGCRQFRRARAGTRLARISAAGALL